MATIVLKERQFEPTGRNLGNFESKDLEAFNIQFEEDDAPNPDMGGSQEKGPVSHVPNPIDDNPLDKDDKGKSSSGSGDGPSPNPDREKKEEDDKPDSGVPNIPDEWDVMGENPDEQDYDTPQFDDSGLDDEDMENIGGGGGDSNSSSSDEESNAESSDSNGKSSSEGEGESSSDNNGGSGDASSDSGSIDSTDGAEGDSGDSQSSNGSGEDAQDSQQGNSQSSGDNSDNGQESNDSNPNNNANGSGENQDSNNQSGNNQNSQSQSQDPNMSSQKSNNSGNNSTQDVEGDGQQDGMTYDKDAVNNTKLFDDEDFDPAGDIKTISDLEKALDKISKSESSSSKEKREAEAVTSDNDNKGDANKPKRPNPNDMRDRAEEAAAAKEILSKAIQDQRDRKAQEQETGESVGGSNTEDEILSDLGAGRLTTLFNPSTAKDWRVQLDRLFDKATGYDIITNPNLVNKKIEDAPPGREDFEPVIKNIVVLLDYSGSMGAVQFKEVISHIDTMLKARKLTRTTFHIFAWGTTDVGILLERYTRCKGAVFKKTINSKFKEGKDGTRLAPVIPLVVKKVHKPDAIIIMTDAEIFDADAFNRSHICTSFIKKFRDKIIWALTSGARVDNVTNFDPTAKARKRYIKFKKGGKG